MEELILELKEKVVSGMHYDTISEPKGRQLLEIISQMQTKLIEDSKICPKCGKKTLVDGEDGEIYCENCATIIGFNLVY